MLNQHELEFQIVYLRAKARQEILESKVIRYGSGKTVIEEWTNKDDIRIEQRYRELCREARILTECELEFVKDVYKDEDRLEQRYRELCRDAEIEEYLKLVE